MIRWFSLLLTVTLLAQTESREPIRIDVGPGKEVTVTVPRVSKADIAALVSTLFSKGDEKAQVRFHTVFNDSTTLTLIITSK